MLTILVFGGTAHRRPFRLRFSWRLYSMKARKPLATIIGKMAFMNLGHFPFAGCIEALHMWRRIVSVRKLSAVADFGPGLSHSTMKYVLCEQTILSHIEPPQLAITMPGG